VLVSGDTLTYTPPASYSGTDSFNYVVTDTYGATNTGTVAVTVYSPTNQPDRVVSIQTLPDGNQGITFAGIPGFTYVVQATPSLSPASWAPVSTNTASLDGLFIFDDLNATNFPTRYYRSVSQ
jgi:hypothetical protein